MRFLINALLLLCTITACASDTNYQNYSRNLDDLIDSLGIDPNSIEVHIDKSDYKLSLVSGDIIIKAYPVVFGGNPVDDKRMEGDQCTPEGTFGMVSKYPHRSWSKFIWINYPTSDSWEKHKQAKEDLRIPQSARIGGEIGIHGVPEGADNMIDLQYNWTLGCISMKNRDVNEIYPFVNEQTVIVISY